VLIVVILPETPAYNNTTLPSGATVLLVLVELREVVPGAVSRLPRGKSLAIRAAPKTLFLISGIRHVRCAAKRFTRNIRLLLPFAHSETPFPDGGA
jgi:hypothetical protein